jgi:hypothetical protein
VKRAIQVSLLSFGKVSKKTVNISGTVGADGKTLVSDKGNRIWNMVNSDVLVARVAVSQSEPMRIRIRTKLLSPWSGCSSSAPQQNSTTWPSEDSRREKRLPSNARY